MGDIVSLCIYGAAILALALAIDYLRMLWMRKQMVQFLGAVQAVVLDTDLQCAAAWTMAVANCRKHVQPT